MRNKFSGKKICASNLLGRGLSSSAMKLY